MTDEDTPGAREIFHGRIIRLEVERVRLPNGSVTELEVVHHPGGAAVVALDGQGRVCLLHQYRHVMGGWLWELPAGKIDVPEPPEHTARRELQEEAGLIAREWRRLGATVSSPGVFTEVVYLFLATGLDPVTRGHERDEVIEVHWVPWPEAVRWARDGTIRDGKTLVALFLAEPLIAGDL